MEAFNKLIDQFNHVKTDTTHQQHLYRLRLQEKPLKKRVVPNLNQSKISHQLSVGLSSKTTNKNDIVQAEYYQQKS